MRIKSSIKRIISYIGSGLLLAGLIGFTESRREMRQIKDLQIMLEHNQGHYFLEDEDVLSLITESGSFNPVGLRQIELNLAELEERLKQNTNTDKVAVYVDLQGNLIAKASQRSPLARFAEPDGDDWYFDASGKLMPLSPKYSARVGLIRGKKAKQWLTEEGYAAEKTRLLAFMQKLSENDFWRAQIAEIEVDSKGEITMLPQIGDQIIEFGALEMVDEKLKKLMIFYKQILPSQGWTRYARVNVSFGNQIICE